jgi:hypothetical protein
MTKIPRLGKQPPQYTFFLNPYTDAWFSKCPKCRGAMGRKKLPLVIHVDDGGLISLNKSCRFCSRCDLLPALPNRVKCRVSWQL